MSKTTQLDRTGTDRGFARRVLALLEQGETEPAKSLLAERFAAGRLGHDASACEQLSYRLHLALTSGTATQDRLTTRVPPATRGGDAEMMAAIQCMDHALAASAALRSGRIDELVSRSRAALQLAPSSMPWIVFFIGSLLQACYRFTGDPALRGAAIGACARIADRIDCPALAVQARALMGNIFMMHGALHRALEHCEAAVALAETTGIEPRFAALAHQFRGYILFEWNRLAEAETALTLAWSSAGPQARGVRSGVARVMAALRSAAGDGAGAQAWLRELELVMQGPTTLRNREWLAAIRAGCLLGPGDLREVECWLRSWDYRPETFATLDTAALLTRLQELDQVLALLEATDQWSTILALAPRVAAAARNERCWFAARATATLAVALEALGRSSEADAHFREALEIGDTGSFVRAYGDGHPIRAALLRRAASAADARALRVLRAMALGAADRPSGGLTPTQTAVLMRVAAGASNKTIARTMGISVSTVKTHLRAIFSKLGVASRTQAAAQAREFGLNGGSVHDWTR